MAREAALLVTLAALGGASLWLRVGEQPPPAAPAAPGAAPAALPPVPATAPAVAAPIPEPPPADRSKYLELPDGSFVPTLNGATNVAPLAKFWGSQVPWSPIVGIERNDQGIDWYRHENGSYSTTQMVLVSRSGRQSYEPMTRVGHRGPANTPATAAGK